MEEEEMVREKISKVISEIPNEDIENIGKVLKMVLLNEKKDVEVEDDNDGSKRINFDSDELTMLNEFKNKLRSKVGTFDSSASITIGEKTTTEESLSEFFIYMCLFPKLEKNGVYVTTKGRELKDLSKYDRYILHFLKLMVMRTKMHEIVIHDSPHSITNFFRFYELFMNRVLEPEKMDEIERDKLINEDVFYGLCAIFDYPVVKNRGVGVVDLKVTKDKDDLVHVTAKITNRKNVQSGKTAGEFFSETDFKPYADLVNNYEKYGQDNGISIVETGKIIASGAYGKVSQGRMTISSKYNGGSNVWKGDVAIKTINAFEYYIGNALPQYSSVEETVNTEIYIWLQLHGGKYVHPEDFEKYIEMPKFKRHGCAASRDNQGLPENFKMPGNVTHGILPIYFIYVSVNAIDNTILINFVSPLMYGSLADISFNSASGNLRKIWLRIKDIGTKASYDIFCKRLLLDMLGGLDSMHNNTEYRGPEFKSFLHCDVKPGNFVWTLQRPKTINDNITVGVDYDEIIVFLTDFGISNKLEDSKYPYQYKLLGEPIHTNVFYTPAFKGRNLRKIEHQSFGVEVDDALIGFTMYTDEESDTREIRILYGFSELADYQALSLSFLSMLSGFLDGNVTNENVLQRTFSRAQSSGFSTFDIMRLLSGNDAVVPNDTLIGQGKVKNCSSICKEMINMIEIFRRNAGADYFDKMKSLNEKYAFLLFLPYSIRPQNYFTKLFNS